MAKYYSLLIIFFCISCQHNSSSFFAKKHFQKQWTINTLSEPYLRSRVFQKTPTLLTDQFVIQGDALYGVRSYDRKYGNVKWFFPVIGGIEGRIHQEKQRIFFGGSDGFFYSLEKETGRVLWKFYTGSEHLGSPFVLDQKVYFVTSKDTLYVLDAVTGKRIWMYVHPLGKTNSLTIRGVSRPLVDSQNIYVAFSNGTFLSINRKTKKTVWRRRLSYKMSKIKDIDSHPVVYGNLIYISSYSDGLFCLNKKTGKIIWKSSLGSHSNPVVKGKYIYYATSDKSILSLNRFSGKKVWSVKVSSLATQPVIYQSMLLYGLSDGGLYFMKQSNGKVTHQLELFKGITVPPALDKVKKELFIFSKEAWLYKLKLLF